MIIFQFQKTPFRLKSLFFLFLLFFARAVSSQILPHKEYSELFHRVQMEQVFEDSKTFPDCIPVHPPGKINKLYQEQKDKKNFNLRDFVLQNFLLPPSTDISYRTQKEHDIKEHINALWPVLTRDADTTCNSSLIPLPKTYIVPGGRFREIYYWDSYFTMLGLKESGKADMIRNMCDNFVSLIERYGHIPNGNRTYYLTRSQPPFFSLMVELLAKIDGDSVYLKYYPALEKEYNFWMKGKETAKPGKPQERVVAVGRRAFLNRYWDNEAIPRPESHREDVLLAKKASDDSALYRNIRAACESGWDFSSRWLKAPNVLESIHTTEILPVDLNCLLYKLELTLAKAAGLTGNRSQEKVYRRLAEERKKNMLHFFWNQEKKFFFDYDFVRRKQKEIVSTAGVYPLYFQIADSNQATAVSRIIKERLLQPGGIVTTVITSGEQWDAPNGWPPMQYLTIEGLKNYGQHELAEDIASRWLLTNRRVFQETGKIMEKYNVMNPAVKAGGGEYPTQDGFGWTNGVYLYLVNASKIKTPERKRKPSRR